MKRFAILVGCLALTSPLLAEQGWQLSLETAKKLAVDAKKPVLAFVCAEWSPFCQRMKGTLRNKRVAGTLQSFVPVRVEAYSKEGRNLIHNLGIHSLPCLVLMDPDGSNAQLLTGYYGPIRLEAKLREAEELREIMPAALKRYQANPSDAAAIETLARLYAQNWNVDKAKPFLERALKLDPANKFGGLARALNSFGDFYQLNSNFDHAVSYFTRASKVGKSNDLYYSYISIGSCYLQRNKPDLATPWFQKILTIPGLTKDQRALVQRFIGPRKNNPNNNGRIRATS